MNWIKIEDEEPEESPKQFLITDGKNVSLGEYFESVEMYEMCASYMSDAYWHDLGRSLTNEEEGDDWLHCLEVTHWMPLPKMPSTNKLSEGIE